MMSFVENYSRRERIGMLLKTILNRLEKHRSFVYSSIHWAEDSEPVIEIEIQPRKGSRPICSECGQACPTYDTLARRRFNFVPLWQIPVVFLYSMRRADCPRCGIKVESVPWAASGKSPLTRSYCWFLANWAKRISWQEVAETFHTSWQTVAQTVEVAVQWGREHMNLDGIESIGVDEIHHRRGVKILGTGPRFLTLVYQIDAGCKRLLWVAEDRAVESLEGFFHWLGPQRVSRLRFICSDMWRPYLKVIRSYAGGALHILDRFHIMAKINRAIDHVRASEMRQLRRKGLHPILANFRWILLKRPENLSEQQEIKLAELLRYNLKAVRSYLLREEFQHFWTYVSPFWAGQFLDRWCSKVMRSQIRPMKEIAKTLRRHRTLLLNWFQAKHISSGIIEGLNSKAKLTMRKSFGFRSFRITELALYHSLGALPEPEFTHRFW